MYRPPNRTHNMNNPIPSTPFLAPPPCSVKSSHEWHTFTHHAINPPSPGRCEDPVRCVLLSKAIITEHSTSNVHPIPFLLLTATFRVQFMFFFLKKKAVPFWFLNFISAPERFDSNEAFPLRRQSQNRSQTKPLNI